MARRETVLARFKQRLGAGEAVVGFQHNSGSEALIEVAGLCGYDFILIDMEHSAYDFGDSERLLRVCELSGVVGLVRVPDHDPHVISRMLDSGAAGVMVPHIRTAEDLHTAMQATQYQPLGTRGKSGMCRAARWGLEPWDGYAEWASDGPLLIPILEDVEAIDNMDSILATPGLQIFAIGAGDLSQAYGEPRLGVRSPQVRAALLRSIEIARARGLWTMTLPAPDLSVELVNELIADGVQVVWFGSDISHYSAALRQAMAGLDLTPASVSS